MTSKTSILVLGLFLVGASGSLRSQFREVVFEGEKLASRAQPSKGTAVSQSMASHGKAWRGGAQLIWVAPRGKESLRVTVPMRNGGDHRLLALFTRGPGYGTFQVFVNGALAGDPIVGAASEVKHGGATELGTFKLRPGLNTLEFRLAAGEGPLRVGLDTLVIFPVPKFEGLKEQIDARYQKWLELFPSSEAGTTGDGEGGDGGD